MGGECGSRVKGKGVGKKRELYIHVLSVHIFCCKYLFAKLTYLAGSPRFISFCITLPAMTSPAVVACPSLTK